MGNTIIKDIVNLIGQDFTIVQIVRMTTINKNICYQIRENVWAHQVADLSFFDQKVICNILDTYNFTNLDLNNTMITDNFNGNLSRVTKLSVKNCVNLTDEFVINNLPCCTHLDLTGCINITGSFILRRPKWTILGLSGCFFIDILNLIKLQQCDILDLSGTIVMSEKFIAGLPVDTLIMFEEMATRCKEIFISKADSFFNNKQFKNSRIIPHVYEPLMPPSLITCCRNIGDNSTLFTSKILVRLYIKERCKMCIKSLQKFRNNQLLNMYREITGGFIAIVEDSVKENVLENSLFFRNTKLTVDVDVDEIMPVQTYDFLAPNNDKITKPAEKFPFWYSDAQLDDMILTGLLPSAFVNCAEVPENINDNTDELQLDVKCQRSLPTTDKYTKKIVLTDFDIYVDRYNRIRKADEEKFQEKMKEIPFNTDIIKDQPLSVEEMNALISQYNDEYPKNNTNSNSLIIDRILIFNPTTNMYDIRNDIPDLSIPNLNLNGNPNDNSDDIYLNENSSDNPDDNFDDDNLHGNPIIHV